MKGLNLDGFKKISSDKNSSTLMHEKGHKLTIMHGALPAIQREQIKRLPIHNYDKGSGDVSNDDKMTVEPVEDDSGDQGQSSSTHGGTHITINAAPAAQPTQASAPVPPMSVEKLPEQPSQPDQSQPEQPQQPVSPVQNLNQNMVNASNEAIKSEQGANQNVQDTFKKVQDVGNEFKQYNKDNPVNPIHYAESLDSDRKAGIATGLALMGFGGTGQAGLDFLNKQIDRDVASQQQNYENKKNVYGAYLSMFDKADIAAKMALATTNDIYAHRMTVAAIPQGPQAIQNAQNFANQKKQMNDQLYGQVAQELSGNGEPKADADGIYTPKPILVPNATEQVQSMSNIKQGPIGENYQDIKKQFDHAAKADNILKQLPDQFRMLKKNATLGGAIGRNNNTSALAGAAGSAAGGVGGAISGALASAKGAIGDLVTAGGAGIFSKSNPKEEFAKNRDYESAKSRIFNDIKAALPDIGVDQIADIVNKNTPDYWDTPSNVNTKMKTIEAFIKNSSRGPLLGGSTGLLNE
jgi:hypothetical protein